MSRKSSRYSNPKNRKNMTIWKSDKDFHNAKLEKKRAVLVKFGLDKIIAI